MKYKKSTYVPLMLFLYLCVMSIVGYDYFLDGQYLFYFGIIGITLVIIILLHFSLKRRESLRRQREDDIKNKENKD